MCNDVQMVSLRMDTGDGAMDEHGGVEYYARRDGLDDARRGSAADNDSRTIDDDGGRKAAARGEGERGEKEKRKRRRRGSTKA